MSSVSAAVERQGFCWESALGVRSQTHLKAQKGVAKRSNTAWAMDLTYNGEPECSADSYQALS